MVDPQAKHVGEAPSAVLSSDAARREEEVQQKEGERGGADGEYLTQERVTQIFQQAPSSQCCLRDYLLIGQTIPKYCITRHFDFHGLAISFRNVKSWLFAQFIDVGIR